MIALGIYIVALFLLGLGNAVITYHLLRYRDPGDASGPVLVAYYIVIGIILVGTALLIDWRSMSFLAGSSSF